MGFIRRELPLPRPWPPPRDRAGVEAAVAAVRRRDPVGHRLHLLLAVAYLVAMPLSTAGSGITFALLLGYAILRGPNTWRCYAALVTMPVPWAFAAWIAWSALSIAWSANPGQGWDELGAARVLLTPLMLWPLLERIPLLVVAALAGVHAQNLVQLAQGLHLFGLLPDPGGRLDGWIHPIQVGAWCAAAMCWHLGAALRVRGARRGLSLAGLAAAAAGLLATGSRGPWISAAVAVPLLLLLTAWRRTEARRTAAVLLVCGTGALAAAWPVAGPMIGPRITRAVHEVRAAREEGVYWTSAGLRVGLWRWAWEIFTEAPVQGRGAGSFQAELWKLEDYRAVLAAADGDAARREYLTRDHAHSTYLHTLAGQGAVGGALLVILAVLGLRRAALDRRDHPYARAAPYVLLTWLIGAQFDCYHLNGHLFGLLAFVLTITLAPAKGSGVFSRVFRR